MKHRKIKSEIAFYLQNFDQIEYREYVDRQTRDCCRIIEKKVEANRGTSDSVVLSTLLSVSPLVRF